MISVVGTIELVWPTANSSCMTSTRKFVRCRAVNSALDASARRLTVRASEHDLGSVEHGCDRMAERHHQRVLGLQDAVDLAQDAGEIVHAVEAAGGDDEVDRSAGGKPEIAEVALVELDPHALSLGHRPPRRDALGRGIHRHRLGAGPGQRERVDLGGDAELEGSRATDVPAEPELTVVRDVRTIGHVRCHSMSVPAVGQRVRDHSLASVP